MPPRQIRINTSDVNALRGVVLSAEAPAGFLAELHEQFCELPRIVGLLAERIGVPKAFPFEINSIDLMASQAEIPVVAEDALKYLFFEKIERGVIKLSGGENAVAQFIAVCSGGKSVMSIFQITCKSS